MKVHQLSPREWGTGIAIGITVAVLTAIIMLIGMRTGISPLPKPLGLAFAETLFGTTLPLPVGLIFHTAWVVGFTLIYVVLFRDALTFMRAFWLAVVLWGLVLIFFFPLVGWGFLGLAVTPKLIAGAAVPHILFALFLWALCRLTLGRQRGAAEPETTRDQTSG